MRLNRLNGVTAAFIAFLAMQFLLQYLPKSYDTFKSTIMPTKHPYGICPDGRKFLHIVGTRFLLRQHAAPPTYVASRLLLLKTFYIPSLNAQTSKQFHIIAGHDPEVPLETLRVFKGYMSELQVPYYIIPTNGMPNVNHTVTIDLRLINVREILKSQSIEIPDDLDIYISSNLDIDDSVHISSVEAIQHAACQDTADTPEKRVLVTFLGNATVWKPSLQNTYGHFRDFKLLRQRDDRGILWSEILSGRNFIMSCHSMILFRMHWVIMNETTVRQHTNDSYCPYIFTKNNVKVLFMNTWGAIYTQTASSHSFPKNKTVLQPINVVEDHLRPFGLIPADVGLTNMLVGGLEEHAPNLLNNVPWFWPRPINPPGN